MSHVGITVSHMSTPHTFSRAVASALATALVAYNWSQRDLAEATGIPLATLNRRLRGQSPLLITETAAICDALGISIAILMTDATVAVA